MKKFSKLFVKKMLNYTNSHCHLFKITEEIILNFNTNKQWEHDYSLYFEVIDYNNCYLSTN